jgi:heme-degrading monooxygenase HmoA
MFVAMNRFKVLTGSEQAFEQVWRSRRSRLDEMHGFVLFHLLRGPEGEGHTLYASHTIWADEAAFRAWTTSEQFRETHRGAGANKPLYLGHPQFEGFTSVEGV